MLIPSARHRLDDLPLWKELAAADLVHGNHKGVGRKAVRAIEAIARYCRNGLRCYCGVSWGKDSVVVGSLVCLANRLHDLEIPLVWIRVEPIANPDCAAVRDAFLQSHEIEYHEISVECRHDESGWHATGTLEEGFRRAAEIVGSRLALVFSRFLRFRKNFRNSGGFRLTPGSTVVRY